MRFRRLYVEKWLGGTADIGRQSELKHSLKRGAVNEFFWTGHAFQRAQEMVRAGFAWDDMVKALASPERVLWSPTYRRPLGRYGDVTIPVALDSLGRAIVLTVLPSNQEGWNRLYESGQSKDREVRDEFMVSKGAEWVDRFDGLRCSSCLRVFEGADLDSARVTQDGYFCIHCYNKCHAPSSSGMQRTWPRNW